MGVEIERKYLVASDAWRALGEPIRIRQGYLSVDERRTVRVRTVGALGKLTVKGRGTGISRAEFEYDVPFVDAEAMLDALCMQPLLEKHRTTIAVGALTWEVDEFFGDNAGLLVAEVELEREEQSIQLPSWVGLEVTHDPRYLNANLIAHPFTRW